MSAAQAVGIGTKMMVEKRKNSRSRSLLAGRIVVGGSSVFYCLVRNYSSTGAKLVLDTITQTPDELTVQIPQQGLSVRARVVWRRGLAIGVRFLTEDRKSGAA
jgi:hypothetical protein